MNTEIFSYNKVTCHNLLWHRLRIQMQLYWDNPES